MNITLKIITLILGVPSGIGTFVWFIDRHTSFAIGFLWFGSFIGVIGLASQLWKKKTL